MLSHRLVLRIITVSVTVGLLLGFRIWMLGGELPRFQEQDNPASFSDSLLTRALTYCYLFYFNAKLLLFPYTLCFDWQMGSIPLMETFADIRIVGTLVFFVYLISLLVHSIFGDTRVSSKGIDHCEVIILCPLMITSAVLQLKIP